jgi:hypothetical protein
MPEVVQSMIPGFHGSPERTLEHSLTMRNLLRKYGLAIVMTCIQFSGLLWREVISPSCLAESLDHWRLGSIPNCIIDWEYAGWMADYWDPLKMTWMECERDTEWLQWLVSSSQNAIRSLMQVENDLDGI